MGKEVRLNDTDLDAIKHEFAMMTLSINEIVDRQHKIFKLINGYPITVLSDGDSREPKNAQVTVNGYATHEDDTPETYSKTGKVIVEAPDAERKGAEINSHVASLVAE
jgi:hypothetical protein